MQRLDAATAPMHIHGFYLSHQISAHIHMHMHLLIESKQNSYIVSNAPFALLPSPARQEVNIRVLEHIAYSSIPSNCFSFAPCANASVSHCTLCKAMAKGSHQHPI